METYRNLKKKKKKKKQDVSKMKSEAVNIGVNLAAGNNSGGSAAGDLCNVGWNVVK